MTAIENLLNTLKEASTDIESGYKGTKAAATRARKNLQQIRDLAKAAREELLAISKGEQDPQTLDLFPTPTPEAE